MSVSTFNFDLMHIKLNTWVYTLARAKCGAKHIGMLNMSCINGMMHCKTDYKPSRHSGFFLIRFKLTCRQHSLQSSFRQLCCT